MPQKKIQVDVAMLTDIGRVRKQNEDAMGLDREQGLYVIADGMGGAAAGDLASRLAVDTFLGYSRQGSLMPISAVQRMEEGILASNRVVFDYAQDQPRLRGMGTTLVALHIPQTVGEKSATVKVTLAHVGDSRCYRVRFDKMEQLTEDHSLVAEQVRLGEITAEEAAWSPMRNVITRAIGSHPFVEAEVQTVTAQSGDLFLLCTDGLLHNLQDWRLERMLTPRALQLEGAARKLVDAANDAGGQDNTSVMLVRIRF